MSEPTAAEDHPQTGDRQRATASSQAGTAVVASGVPPILKLEGRSNYGSWSFGMKMFLVDCGLWNCVECPEVFANESANFKRDLQEKLLEIDAGLDDEFVGVIMLAGLSENYKPLIMALEHSGVQISSDSVATGF
ncbi:hypothetical protein ACJJTC_010760 [Scirpophaga incertulas]